MKLEILTPDKKVFEGEVRSVTVPGTMGSFEVLKDHAPVISTLEDGKVIIRTDKDEETIFIKGGVRIPERQIKKGSPSDQQIEGLFLCP
ncbi:MAG TPA: F0F1 ATP synthase subunit epsilon [Daejeonella sp.]|nr:F0F1 ATP synthase subunit epsilon [Daejeonella sp.]